MKYILWNKRVIKVYVDHHIELLTDNRIMTRNSSSSFNVCNFDKNFIAGPFHDVYCYSKIGFAGTKSVSKTSAGLINYDGEIVYETDYCDLFSNIYGLVVEKHSNFCSINDINSKRQLINARHISHNEAWFFCEFSYGECKFISRDMEAFTPPSWWRYDAMSNMGIDGIAKCTFEQKTHYIDRNMNIVYSTPAGWKGSNINNGLIVLSSLHGGLEGVAEFDGDILLRPIYNRIWLTDNYIVALDESRYSILSRVDLTQVREFPLVSWRIENVGNNTIHMVNNGKSIIFGLDSVITEIASSSNYCPRLMYSSDTYLLDDVASFL